jgi:hypothetical protein
MEGYFMKNLKSILKKLTLILLASFLLVGSQHLLAVDSDSESEASFDVSDGREIKFVLQDGTEIFLPETVDPNISGYISSLVDISGPEVEIKIDEDSPENIRKVCDERIIRKLIGYLELVSEGTSLLMLRSNLEEESLEDFKALAVLANYFDVNSLMHACAPRCVETLTSLDNLNKFKQDPTMTELFKDCFPGWRWLGFYQYLRYFSNGFDYKEVHEGRYESRVEGIKQSRCGNFVFVLLKNKSLKILKRDRDTGQYVELGSYDNVYDYNVSADGKTICVKYNYNRQQGTFSLKILRLNGSRFVEVNIHETSYVYDILLEGKMVCVRSLGGFLKIYRWNRRRFVESGIYKNVRDYSISKDGNTVCVRFDDNMGTDSYLLKILRLDGKKIVEYPEIYENVFGDKILEDGKIVFVRCNLNQDSKSYSLKIYRWNRRGVVEVLTYENVSSYETSSDGKIVFVGFGDGFLKIYKWNRRGVAEVLTCGNIRTYGISADGKTFGVRFGGSVLKIYRWNGRGFVEVGTCKSVRYYEVSSDGKTVGVRFGGSVLKIYRWDGSRFIEHPVTCKKVHRYKISSDCKTVYVRCNLNQDSKSYTLKILRLNENEFVECDNIVGYEVLEDGKSVCVKYVYDYVTRCPLFKIVRWNGIGFVESEIYENFRSYDISKDGNTVYVNFNDNSLRILRFDGSRFLEVVLYRNIENCEISANGKIVCVEFVGGFLLKILRFDGTRFVEVGSSVNFERCEFLEDGKTVCIKYVSNRYARHCLLKILRFNGTRFVETESYKDVRSYYVSDCKKVCIVFADGRFKILRKYPKVKNFEQAMFVYLAKKEQESGGLDLKRSDSGEKSTTGLLQILGSFDETARSYLIEKYKIKVDPQNIKQAMFLKLAVEKYDSDTQTGLDLTSDSEEQNTTDLLETFRLMPTETQSGLIRDWKVKVSAEIELELGVDQAEAEAEA